MALRALVLRKKIDAKKTQFEELRSKDKEFETREAQLEKDIDEAETEEEQEAVEEEVKKFSDEKDEYEEAKKALSEEIEDLEEELKKIEESAPNPEERMKVKGKERTIREMIPITNANIRSLPKSIRAFDSLTMEKRYEIMNSTETKDFIARARALKGVNRGVTGAELNIPVQFLEIIAENKYRYSKLKDKIRVRTVTGEARQTIVGTVPEAVWTEMCAEINELSFVFNQKTLDGYKVAGFIPICNSMLEDATDMDLAATIIEMISEAIGLAEDKAILYGKGATSKMPMGIVTRLAQTSAPPDYPANAPAWEDLHTSNIIKIDSSLSGAEFWSALTLAAGNTFTKYSRGEQFWVMNSKTHSLLKSKAITFTATGDIVANIFGTLPVINGNVDVLEFIPDGDIIGGYGDLYLWVQRGGMTIEQSREVQFIQDNTVFKGKERADGTPIIPGAFVAINIKNVDVTTTMNFAADTANDAKLQGMTIGSETLNPVFDPETLSYTVTASGTSAKVEATPYQADAEIAISYNSKNVRNGGTITWETGTLPVTVTVRKGNAVRVYTVNVTK